jgi:hypothetical protein
MAETLVIHMRDPADGPVRRVGRPQPLLGVLGRQALIGRFKLLQERLLRDAPKRRRG